MEPRMDDSIVYRSIRGLPDGLRFLSEAQGIQELSQRIIWVTRQLVGVSSTNVAFFGLGATEAGPQGHARFWNEGWAGYYSDFQKVFPITAQECGDPREMRDRGRAVDLCETYGLSYLRKTVSYNDFWNEWQVERQLVSVFRTEGEEVGFFCLARPEWRRRFSPKDAEVAARLCQHLEGVLTHHIRAPLPSSRPEEVLEVLARGMAHPAMVLDSTGRLVWSNEEGRLWLGLDGLSSKRFQVVSWVARRVAARPERMADIVCGVPGEVLGRGEKLGVRFANAHGTQETHVVVTVVFELGLGGDGGGGGLGRGGGVEGAKGDGVEGGEWAGWARKLTPREREVAQLAVEGHTALNIAGVLNISLNTVHTHIKRIYKKLEVRSRSELARVLLGF